MVGSSPHRVGAVPSVLEPEVPMLVKGLALAALVASTPLALVVAQDPVRVGEKPTRATKETRDRDAELRRANTTLVRTRTELEAAQKDLQRLRRQLDAALDRLEAEQQPQRERNCSPSRGRALMSHYQWLRNQGHQERAHGTLLTVVEQIGDNQSRLNGVAWDLMTDKETAGQFDEVALAIARRMEQQGESMAHQHLDTAALAHFLNGEVQRAIDLQRQAIAKGGRSDDYRRRLRTYEAAQDAVAKAGETVATPAATLIAAKDEE
jgi:HAMP domain-containing protein